MRAFPLFQSHLDLAHSYWQKLLSSEDKVIDATCGNGKDTLYLATLIPKGQLFSIDIQATAIANTKKFLQNSLIESSHIQFFQQSHQTFPSCIEQGSIKLVVYNLGYLPGGNKQLTTASSTTLSSVETALSLLKHNGVITITCYPGHTEGKHEEEALIEWGRHLPPKEWSFSYQQWLNRQNSPSLLIIQKNGHVHVD